jgi:arylsulfatase A-like enzyme
LQARKELVKKYQSKAERLQPSTRPEFVPEHDHKTHQVQNHPTYAAMVESLDASVGRVMSELERLGLQQNTVIVFTSDNGGLSTAEGSPTSNYPLRAGKGWPYEGGVREPYIIFWPGVTRAGAQYATPIISLDLYPTFLEMAGAKVPAEQQIHGQSIVSMLKGGSLPERDLFWHYPHYSNQGTRPNAVIRSGDFKLIEWFEDRTVELYNLRNDESESRDLSKTMPELAPKLRNRLHAWQKEMDAQVPSPNPEYK